MKQPLELKYSPIDYSNDPEIIKIYSRLNEGVPMESGHLYWSMMTNYACPQVFSFETTLGDKCSDVGYWNQLKKVLPFIDLSSSNLTNACFLTFHLAFFWSESRILY